MFKRHKLTFLGTKDNSYEWMKVINSRINLTEKHLVDMCAMFAACTRKMAKCRDTYDELAKSLKNYADDEEINDSLSEGMKSFTKALTILGDYMDLNVHRMEQKIVNELGQFETLCKNTRENLRCAVVARDKEVLKQRQMMDLKTKFAANNPAADSELVKAKMEVTRATKEIDEIICTFEKRKLSDIKKILTDFILISMKYHTKALEALTASYFDISNMDEKGDFKEFQKVIRQLEEPGKKKSMMKKAQSMDIVTGDQSSPLKKHVRMSKSTKTLSAGNDNDEEDEEDDSDNNSNPDDDEDQSSSSSSDEEDDDPDDEPSETLSEASKPPVDDKKKKLNQTFKAASAVTRVILSNRTHNSSSIFGTPPLPSSQSIPLTLNLQDEESIVTVVESKGTAGARQQLNHMIDCRKGHGQRISRKWL